MIVTYNAQIQACLQGENDLSDFLVRISEAELQAGGPILKEKMLRAAKTGLFYLEIPKSCKSLVAKMDQFARSVFKNEKWKELFLEGGRVLRPASLDGKEQRESFSMRKEYWRKYLPFEVSIMAEEMHLLALNFLKKTYHLFGIPKDKYSAVSGKVLEGKGITPLLCNHYLPEVDATGLEPHVDGDQIALLYIDQSEEALEAKINQEWVKIPPIQDYFVSIYGIGAEASIGQSNLHAPLHRVIQVSKDRYSWLVFLVNDPDEIMHVKDGESIVSKGVTFDEYKCSLISKT